MIPITPLTIQQFQSTIPSIALIRSGRHKMPLGRNIHTPSHGSHVISLRLLCALLHCNSQSGPRPIASINMYSAKVLDNPVGTLVFANGPRNELRYLLEALLYFFQVRVGVHVLRVARRDVKSKRRCIERKGRVVRYVARQRYRIAKLPYVYQWMNCLRVTRWPGILPQLKSSAPRRERRWDGYIHLCANIVEPRAVRTNTQKIHLRQEAVFCSARCGISYEHTTISSLLKSLRTSSTQRTDRPLDRLPRIVLQRSPAGMHL